MVDEWRRSWPVLLASVGIGVIVGITTASAALMLLAIAVQLISLWRLVLPMKYEINYSGVDQRFFGRVTHTPWPAIRGCQVLRHGLLLTSEQALWPWKTWRSLYVPWGRRRALVLAGLDLIANK